ncbi:MAG: T9SS type A sorting domain-containing protein [Candidatus Kapaibacterium sp.]
MRNTINALLVLLLLFPGVMPGDLFAQDRWVRTYGGSKREWGTTVMQAPDGGYVMTGGTWSDDKLFQGYGKGDVDGFVVKTDADGIVQWRQVFGGSTYEVTNGIALTADSAVVVCGYFFSNDRDFAGLNRGMHDVFIIKMDRNGKVLWKTTYGGSENENATCIITTPDGGFAVCGDTRSSDGDFSRSSPRGGSNIFLLRLNARGEKLWNITYGGSKDEGGERVINTRDGGFAIVGDMASNDGDFSRMNKGAGDIFLMKTDARGAVQWTRSFGGSKVDRGMSVTQTDDDGFALAGWTLSTDGDFLGSRANADPDAVVVRTDSAGGTVWTRRFGGSREDRAFCIAATADAGYLMTGGSWSADGDMAGIHKGMSDIFLTKMDSTGTTQWTRSYGSISDEEQGYHLARTRDGGCVLTGYTESSSEDFAGMNNGLGDVFLLKLDAEASPLGRDSVFVYPNVASTTITVVCTTMRNASLRIDLVDVMGRVVAQVADAVTTAGTTTFRHSVSALPMGMYLVRMTTPDETMCTKVMIVR